MFALVLTFIHSAGILSDIIHRNFVPGRGTHAVIAKVDKTLDPRVQSEAVRSLFSCMAMEESHIGGQGEGASQVPAEGASHVPTKGASHVPTESTSERSYDEGGRFQHKVNALLAGPGWGKSFTADEISCKTAAVKEVARTVQLPSGESFLSVLEKATTIPITFNHITNEIASSDTPEFSLVARVLFRFAAITCRFLAYFLLRTRIC